ncbi:MAG: hypothetical protein JWQ74_3190 [Marmoricola sp.]|nr:hypothetical protein [Marmoricola sp.]
MDAVTGSTPDRLIAAGLEALLELTPADLVSAVGTRQIAARAGVSAATLMNRFGSVAAYADALVARVFDPGSFPVEELREGLTRIVRAGLPAEAADAYHRSDFSRLTTDPGLRLRMGLWALGAGATDSAYRDFLRVTDARFAEVAEAMVASWGREFRPPFTAPVFVAAQVALLNGLSIRHLIDPDLSTADRFSLTATALTMISLRVQGDRHDMADRVAEINYYPLRNSRTGAEVTAGAQRTRATLLSAAAELFGSRGYEETTASQIARHAGLSASTLYKHFGSKSAIASALFLKQAEDMLVSRAAAGPRRTSTRPLVDYLVEVVVFVAHRTEYAGAYLTDLISNRPSLDDALLAGAVPLVATRLGAGDGECPPAPDAADVTQVLLATLIGRVLARPADRPSVQVNNALSLVLGGALAEA